ncbi:hypothetical protein, partial [Paraburkholderia sp. RL18-085-BIA-A]|uniref:hypothetical protein n=1 Tax=Paraburkholderia sp. RL18-085-BIA-A TaxID=3031633 RepID=UPI0038BBD7A2
LDSPAGGGRRPRREAQTENGAEQQRQYGAKHPAARQVSECKRRCGRQSSLKGLSETAHFIRRQHREHIQHRLAEGHWTSANTRYGSGECGLGDFPDCSARSLQTWRRRRAPMIALKPHFFISEPTGIKKQAVDANTANPLICI